MDYTAARLCWVAPANISLTRPSVSHVSNITNASEVGVKCPRRMNLPNTLTLVRMFLVPLLVVVLLTEFEGRQIFGVPKELAGAAIFGLASLTDWLDGYIARRRRQITWLGQM